MCLHLVVMEHLRRVVELWGVILVIEPRVSGLVLRIEQLIIVIRLWIVLTPFSVLSRCVNRPWHTVFMRYMLGMINLMIVLM